MKLFRLVMATLLLPVASGTQAEEAIPCSVLVSPNGQYAFRIRGDIYFQEGVTDPKFNETPCRVVERGGGNVTVFWGADPALDFRPKGKSVNAYTGEEYGVPEEEESIPDEADDLMDQVLKRRKAEREKATKGTAPSLPEVKIPIPTAREAPGAD